MNKINNNNNKHGVENGVPGMARWRIKAYSESDSGSEDAVVRETLTHRH